MAGGPRSPRVSLLGAMVDAHGVNFGVLSRQLAKAGPKNQYAIRLASNGTLTCSCGGVRLWSGVGEAATCAHLRQIISMGELFFLPHGCRWKWHGGNEVQVLALLAPGEDAEHRHARQQTTMSLALQIRAGQMVELGAVPMTVADADRLAAFLVKAMAERGYEWLPSEFREGLKQRAGRVPKVRPPARVDKRMRLISLTDDEEE